MSQDKRHDLYDFMRQISADMAAEYHRIQKRATEDPGTAGDQGEENWATLLRDWLPQTYEVVTKGRIISQDGATSPQIDVLVLHETYPKKLLDKKLYLAAGVAAAFECKTTLKASHISEAVEKCVEVKSLYPTRVGTPYRELHSPMVYGLLAHSHSWKCEKSTPEQNIEQKLQDSDKAHVAHPRLQLDFLCVADLATWNSSAMTFIRPRHVSDADIYGPSGSATTTYMCHSCAKGQVDQFTPIGVLISYLSQKLAWENPSLRGLADYYRLVDIAGPGRGEMRMWPSTIYSGETRARVEAGHFGNGKPWDEWPSFF